MIILTIFKPEALLFAQKTKTNQLHAIPLIEKTEFSYQQEFSNDPKTYYNLLHWSILEMNSGRDINTATARKTTDPMNHSGFIPNNRHTAMLFNQSVLEKRE